MKIERLCGIYKITSPSGRIYIGQCLDHVSRWNSYKNMKCEKQPLLYKSFLKHGVENHIFEMIHVLDTSIMTKSEIKLMLNELEISYIKDNASFKIKGNNGLNLTTGGHSTEFSEEVIQKISNKARGRKISPETISKIVAKTTGQKRSEDTKDKISKKLIGRTFSEEHKKNISKAKKGVKMQKPKSEESRLKTSLALKGKKKSPEAIKKSADSKRGVPHTIEAKKKISEGLKGDKNPNYGKRGKDSPNYGKKVSPETLAKLSGENHWTKRKKISEETRKKQSEARKGKKQSEETKAKRRGKKKNPESIAKREATKKRNRELIEEEKRMMIF